MEKEEKKEVVAKKTATKTAKKTTKPQEEGIKTVPKKKTTAKATTAKKETKKVEKPAEKTTKGAKSTATKKSTTTKAKSTKATTSKKAEPKQEKVETPTKKTTRTSVKSNSKTRKEEEKTEETNEKKSLMEVDITNKETLDKIKKVMQDQKTIPEDKKKLCNLVITKNMLIAAAIIAYFLYINLGLMTIEPALFLTGLKVLSVIMILFTILVFEVAYRKDSGSLAVHGIEALALAITTLMMVFIYQIQYERFTGIATTISILFAIYYSIKNLHINRKMKKNYQLEKQDIQNIVK